MTVYFNVYDHNTGEPIRNAEFGCYEVAEFQTDYYFGVQGDDSPYYYFVEPYMQHQGDTGGCIIRVYAPGYWTLQMWGEASQGYDVTLVPAE